MLRALSQGGFADLKKIHLWNLGFVNKSPEGKKFKEIEDKISDSLSFMEACGIHPDHNRRLRTVNFYTSHEALLLPFEQSMTRIDSTSGTYHDTSAHFVWIGDRTRQPDGGHVEFCRGIENPIGIKCGPTSKPEEIVKICNVINPKNEKGKITLISRFGHENVEKFLPKLIRTIKKEGLNQHLDGAWVWHSIIENNINPVEIGQAVDSLTFCFSKGLGAPVGSMLLGSREFIRKARLVRKTLGGGMRQVGVLAAAAKFALGNRSNILKDHEKAKKIYTFVFMGENEFLFAGKNMDVVKTRKTCLRRRRKIFLK